MDIFGADYVPRYVSGCLSFCFVFGCIVRMMRQSLSAQSLS